MHKKSTFKLKKEIFFNVLTLLVTVISVACIFSILSYSKIADNIYHNIHPMISTSNIREAFINLQNAGEFNITKVSYLNKDQKPLILFESQPTFLVFTKTKPFFLSKDLKHSIGILEIQFNIIPELKSLFISLVILTFIKLKFVFAFLTLFCFLISK